MGMCIESPFWEGYVARYGYRNSNLHTLAYYLANSNVRKEANLLTDWIIGRLK